MKKGTEMHKKHDMTIGEENKLDLEEMTIIKWAAERLTEAIQGYEKEKQKSKYNYLFKTLTIDYYSRARLEKLESKSVDFGRRDYQRLGMVPVAPKATESRLDQELNDVLYIKHPDLSTVVYYPSGRVAMVQSVVREAIETIVFDDSNGFVLASFSSRGFGSIDGIIDGELYRRCG